MLPFIEIGAKQIDSAVFFLIAGTVVALTAYAVFGSRYGLKRYTALFSGVGLWIAEVLGAKLLYIAENFSYVSETGITFSGLSFFGIMFTVPLFSLLFAKLTRIPYGQFLDFAVTGILIQLVFYRIGCTLVGCCNGFECPWGIPGSDGLRYFPVQPIEAALDLLLCVVLFVLYIKGKLRRGEQYLLYMAGYGTVRFILEFTRVRTVLFAGISLSHIWAFLAVVVGASILFARRVKAERETNNE